MVTYTPTGSQPPEVQTKVEQIERVFSNARVRRASFEGQWQESSLMAWPEYANTFSFGYGQTPGAKKAMQQLDSSASIASHRFGAIMDSLITPQHIVWSRLKHPDSYVMKQRGVQKFYDQFSELLWSYRYNAVANFVGSNTQNMQGLGVFGNMNMYVEAIDRKLFPGHKGPRYSSMPVGQIYYIPNHQGAVDSYFNAFQWTARMIAQCWPDTFPEALKPALDQNSQERFWIIQYVCPRTDDWQPWVFGPKNKRYASYYISLSGKIMLEESGYRTFPMPHGRYMLAPDEDYGRGPAQMVLATMKTKNAMKGVFMEQGHRAGKPIFLLPEDGLINPQFHPGGFVQGGMSDAGKPRVGVLPVGNINITKEMMDDEQVILDDAFLVSLFKWALKTDEMPNMSARQVVEMLEKHAIFLAPTAGRQMTEYLANMIPREVDVLGAEGCLKVLNPPPVLREAGLLYDPDFDNPMTRMQAASEVAGYMQTVEMTAEIVKTTGKQDLWDLFDFETSLPDIGRRRGYPVSWMANEQQKKQRANARAQAEQRDREVKELPGRAAIMKAQAITAKAQSGGNTGGTLSGVPEGQMPMMPNQGPPGVPSIGG